MLASVLGRRGQAADGAPPEKWGRQPSFRRMTSAGEGRVGSTTPSPEALGTFSGFCRPVSDRNRPVACVGLPVGCPGWGDLHCGGTPGTGGTPRVFVLPGLRFPPLRGAPWPGRIVPAGLWSPADSASGGCGCRRDGVECGWLIRLRCPAPQRHCGRAV